MVNDLPEKSFSLPQGGAMLLVFPTTLLMNAPPKSGAGKTLRFRKR
jgi:hypothetical protein